MESEELRFGTSEELQVRLLAEIDDYCEMVPTNYRCILLAVVSLLGTTIKTIEGKSGSREADQVRRWVIESMERLPLGSTGRRR